MASKYEDIYPIHSNVAYEKISHKAVSQKEILNLEREFLMTLDFDFDLVTIYDIYLYMFIVIKDQLNQRSSYQDDILKKVEELTL